MKGPDGVVKRPDSVMKRPAGVIKLDGVENPAVSENDHLLWQNINSLKKRPAIVAKKQMV